MNDLDELERNFELKLISFTDVMTWVRKRENEFNKQLIVDEDIEQAALNEEYDKGYSRGFEDGTGEEKDNIQTRLNEAFDNGRKDALKNPDLARKQLGQL